jgi:hypothetical protein
MYPLSNILLVAPVLGLAAAAPAPQATPTAACSQHYSPDFYQVFLDYPDHNVTVPNNHSPTLPNQNFYMVQGVYRKDSRGAVISFSGNPTSAESCTLGWSQSIKGSNLANYGAATALNIYQLDLGGKVLTDVVEKVTYNTIKPIIKPGPVFGGADFGGWGNTAKDGSHTSGTTECAEEMGFYVEFSSEVEEGMIVMLQNPAIKAGWFLSHTGAC